MIDIKVKDVIKICNGKLVYGDENIICENFSKDTRFIEKNDVYIGIKGQNFDRKRCKCMYFARCRY